MLYLVAAEGHTCFDCSFQWLVDDKGRSLFVKPVIASLKALVGRNVAPRNYPRVPQSKKKRRRRKKSTILNILKL
jgi:hypothetical protein